MSGGMADEFCFSHEIKYTQTTPSRVFCVRNVADVKDKIKMISESEANMIVFNIVHYKSSLEERIRGLETETRDFWHIEPRSKLKANQRRELIRLDNAKASMKTVTELENYLNEALKTPAVTFESTDQCFYSVVDNNGSVVKIRDPVVLIQLFTYKRFADCEEMIRRIQVRTEEFEDLVIEHGSRDLEEMGPRELLNHWSHQRIFRRIVEFFRTLERAITVLMKIRSCVSYEDFIRTVCRLTREGMEWAAVCITYDEFYQGPLDGVLNLAWKNNCISCVSFMISLLDIEHAGEITEMIHPMSESDRGRIVRITNSVEEELQRIHGQFQANSFSSEFLHIEGEWLSNEEVFNLEFRKIGALVLEIKLYLFCLEVASIDDFVEKIYQLDDDTVEIMFASIEAALEFDPENKRFIMFQEHVEIYFSLGRCTTIGKLFKYITARGDENYPCVYCHFRHGKYGIYLEFERVTDAIIVLENIGDSMTFSNHLFSLTRRDRVNVCKWFVKYEPNLCRVTKNLANVYYRLYTSGFKVACVSRLKKGWVVRDKIDVLIESAQSRVRMFKSTLKEGNVGFNKNLIEYNIKTLENEIAMFGKVRLEFLILRPAWSGNC